MIIGVWLDDEGSYICEANNPFGTIKTEARVSVTGLGMFLRKLCESTATGFLKYILVHLVFMASRLHSAALVKSVLLIFLEHESRLSFNLQTVGKIHMIFWARVVSIS